MIGYLPDYFQDTVSKKDIAIQAGTDSLSAISQADSSANDNIRQDSSLVKISRRVNAGRVHSIVRNENVSEETTEVCSRNPVADLTFRNPDFIIRSIDIGVLNQFPYLFTEKNINIRTERKASAIKHLRDGENLPPGMFHHDWTIIIFLVSATLFSLVQTVSKSFIPGIGRFFLFRGTGDDGAREMPGLFQWQSTVLNFSSFLVIALFTFFAASYYSLIPAGIPDIAAYLITLTSVAGSVTLRHLICSGTGILSNHRTVYQDYLHTIYQSYRFGAIFFFALTIMMSYTTIFTDEAYFITGAIAAGILYIIRILRLLILFINRNISIFYLFLYLCALEILPVLITIKFFSGLA